MSSFNEIKQTFESVVSKSSWWSKHLGSQFVDYLILFVSKIVDRVTTSSERALQESFLSLATTRSAILANAESEGYVGRKADPSKGKAIIKNTGVQRLSLPALAQCVAKNSIRYTIIQSVDLQPGESIEVDLWQFEVMQINHKFNASEPWQSVLFPKSLTSQIHKIRISINGEEWTHAFKFRDTTAESLSYMEYYRNTDQYGIRFGNGYNGKMPEIGDIANFELWLTNGPTTLMNDQELELVNTAFFDPSNITCEIKTLTVIQSGAFAEDIESIRNSALYSSIFDEQIAWDNDYKTFIKRNISGVNWLSVWGEKEQEKLIGEKKIEHINTIFISTYSSLKSTEILNKEILDLFSKREGYNEKYQIIERKKLTYSVNVKGCVLQNKDPEWAKNRVTEELERLYGENAIYTSPVHKNSIWKTIQSLSVELGIQSFEIEINGLLDSLDLPIDTHHFLDIELSSIDFIF